MAYEKEKKDVITIQVARSGLATIDLRTERVVLDDPVLGFLADLEVSLRYADGSEQTVRTDSQGSFPVETSRGWTIDYSFDRGNQRETRRLFIHPDSVSTKSGAWQRLCNLGNAEIPEPEDEPPSDEIFESALMSFQAEHGIVPSGELDQKTQDKLAEIADAASTWSELANAIIDDDDEGSDRPKDLSS